VKVFQLEAPRKAEYRDIPLRSLEFDEVLVKVAFTGICGTDISFYNGDTDLVLNGYVKYPIRIGHEWSGIVEDAGYAVKKFKKGDRVVGDSGVACGRCAACGAKKYHDCMNIHSVGTINCWDGSFAEYIIMPERHLFSLPDSISLECASLIEPASISYNGLTRCDITGKTVAIIGTGPIGMTSVALARSMGAHNVVMIGRTDFKLEIAKRIGANHVINSTTESMTGGMARCNDGRGADLVIEASGSASEIFNAFSIARRKGMVALLAFYDRTVDGFHVDDFILKEINLTGVLGSFGAPANVIREIAKGNIDLCPLITHRIKFGEVLGVFEKCGEIKDKIKIVVEM